MSETANIRQAAELRVQRSQQLCGLRDVIMRDWPEGDAHWQWVATAPAADIIRWATSLADGDRATTQATALSTGKAAAALGVSRRTVTNWCETGRIAGAYKTPGGHWRVPAETVARLTEKERGPWTAEDHRDARPATSS